MSQTTRALSTTKVVADILMVAAILIALVNNGSYQWAIGMPVVLAIVGVGLRIEAALVTRRTS